MFDAKSLLNMVMGAAQQGGQQGGVGGMLGSVLDGLQNQAQQGAQGAAGGLGGMLGGVLGGLQGKAQEMGAQAEGMAQNLPGGVNDAIAQAQEAIRTGNYGALAEQAKSMLQNNAGGLIAGSLAGLALGTKSGRSILGGAAKLGGLALVGGLAYMAYQRYENGQPVLGKGDAVQAAPAGSGFADGDGDDQSRALVIVRAMVAAAAADGEIDAAEYQRILGNLKQQGLADEAAAFLDQEFAAPLTAASLAELADGPALAAQIYTAARIAIDPDTEEEQSFLADLAGGLGLDGDLVAHIDAAAASVVSRQAA
jgi:uncharacterized membrane protein YebE (DUF533 family)